MPKKTGATTGFPSGWTGNPHVAYWSSGHCDPFDAAGNIVSQSCANFLLGRVLISNSRPARYCSMI